MSLTTDTCTTAVYIFLFFFWSLVIYCQHYRYLASDLRNVVLFFLGTSDTRALNNPPLSKVQAAQTVSKQCTHLHPVCKRTMDKARHDLFTHKSKVSDLALKYQ